MTFDKHPTSILLPDGTNDELDKLAAILTLKHGRRHTRADAHRLALSTGIVHLKAAVETDGGATLDGPTLENR